MFDFDGILILTSCALTALSGLRTAIAGFLNNDDRIDASGIVPFPIRPLRTVVSIAVCLTGTVIGLLYLLSPASLVGIQDCLINIARIICIASILGFVFRTVGAVLTSTLSLEGLFYNLVDFNASNISFGIAGPMFFWIIYVLYGILLYVLSNGALANGTLYSVAYFQLVSLLILPRILDLAFPTLFGIGPLLCFAHAAITTITTVIIMFLTLFGLPFSTVFWIELVIAIITSKLAADQYNAFYIVWGIR